MGIFQALVRTTINVATLPVDLAKDTVFLIDDGEDGNIGKHTRKKLQTIKDEASTEDLNNG
jgi:hypothetical protein